MEEEEGESRDWAGMQSDALSTIFGKLDAADLLTGARQVCHAARGAVSLTETPRCGVAST